MTPQIARSALIAIMEATRELSTIKHSGWPDISRVAMQYTRNTGVRRVDLDKVRTMTVEQLALLGSGHAQEVEGQSEIPH